MYNYKVSTQHSGSPAFIVPIELVAGSALGAAEDRFARQRFESQKDTTALLVNDGHDAHIFPVGLIPGVGPVVVSLPLQFN